MTGPTPRHAVPVKTTATEPGRPTPARPAAPGWRRALGNSAVAALAATTGHPERDADSSADRLTGTRWAAAGTAPSPTTTGSPMPQAAGRPLADGVRARFEAGFAADLGTVRVHTDAAAHRAAEQLGAAAFAAGEHIAFARGNYAPETSRGAWLLAHEIAHVLQHDPGGPAVVRCAPEDVPMLDRKLYEGVQRNSADGYREAAEALNAFSVDDIRLRLSRTPGAGRRPLSRGQIAAVHVAARDHPLLGPGSNAATYTRATFLDVNVDNEIALGHWAAAAELLNAFSDPDMKARLATFAPDRLVSLQRGADENPRVGRGSALAKNVAAAIATRASTPAPAQRPQLPPTPQQAARLRAWAETPAVDPPRPEPPAPAPTASGTKLSTLVLLTAEIGLSIIGIEVRKAVPDRFFEFGSARRGFVAGVTGIPLQPPTDEFELKEWERGENVAAIVVAAEMATGGTAPPGGGGRPGPALAPVGGGRVHLDGPTVPAVPGAPVLQATTPRPSGGAATTEAAAPPARAPAPAPESDAERRARIARTAAEKSPATKPGETPKQAKERTDAEREQYEKSGGKVDTIVGETQLHHVVSNKSPHSPATKQSIEILQNARTSPSQPDLLTSSPNLVRVEHHGDAHGENYHVIVRDRLVSAVRGKTPHTPEYREAVLDELGALRRDCQREGSTLNRMTIKVSEGGMR